MATLVLSAVGNALLPGVGGVVLGAVGGYIDSAVLFPPPDQKGPRLDDLKIGSSVEGSPINLVLATERCAGTVIWKTKPVEHKSQSGKGGPSVTSYTYSVSLAVSICEGPIYRVKQIYANGNLLFDADADVAITSNQVAVARTSVFTWNTLTLTNIETVYMDLTSPDGGPDLSKLRSGKNATTSGFAAGGNNGTFRVVSSSIDELTGVSTARLRNSGAVTASSGATVTITQNLDEFSPNKAGGFTFHTGTESQTPDPLMEAHLGSGQVSAYRGLAYVVIEDLSLGDFGNSIPQFNFIVEETNGTKTRAAAITQLCAKSSRPAPEFDVTGVTGNLRGYMMRGPQPITDRLRPLLIGYDILTQQKGGVLHFFDRVDAERVAVEAEEVGAHEPGQEIPRPFDVNPVSKPDLPIMVVVNYVDPTTDEGRGAQSYRGRRVSATSDNVVTIDLPIVLTASEAQDIARRVYWTAQANRNKVPFSLPPSMMTVQENDRVEFDAQDTDWSLLVAKGDRGVNHLMQLDSVTEQDDVLTFVNSPAAPPAYSRQRVYSTPEMEAILIDLAPLRTEDEEQPGFYRAAAYLDSSIIFVGGGLYASDDDLTFDVEAEIDAEATMGRTTNAPSSSGISAAYWDRKTVLNVKLYGGALSSAGETEVMNGKNRALWGREIIGFATASVQGDGSYNVSNLLRGLRDTDDAMLTHVAGEPFVHLDGGGIRFQPLSLSEMDRTRYFKAVGLGGIVSQFPSFAHLQECNTMRHFRPVQFAGVRDSVTSDLTLTWVRSTRAVWRVLGTTAPPLLDSLEVYQLDVLDDAENNVLRTITITAATTVTYTATQQIADFGATHANAHLRLYQVHSITGRSKAATLVA